MTKTKDEGVTFWLLMSLLSAAFGSSFLFGYNMGVMNAPQNIIGLWIRKTRCARNGGAPSVDEGDTGDLWCKKLDSEGITAMFTDNVELNTLWALINCLIPGGGIIGALASPYLTARFGPKFSMLLNNVPALVAVLLTSLSRTADSVEMLIIGRLFAGINSGITAGVIPTYLTEIAPVRLRGAVGSVHQFFIIISIWISQILGLPFIFGNENHWPVLLALAAAPSLYQLIALPFCPDSPKYLLFTKRDEDAARHALIRLRGTKSVDEELDVIKGEYYVIKDEPVVTVKDLFRDRFLRRTFFIACGLMVFHQLSGIDAVAFYSTAIFQSAGLAGVNAQYATIGYGAISIAMTFISLVLVDRAGRRSLLLIGNFGMAVFLVLLTICMILHKSGVPGPEFPSCSNRFEWAAYASSVSLVGFGIMFAAGPGTIPWIMMSELFAQGPRTAAAGSLAASNRFASLTVALSFPYMQAAINEYSFIVFIVCLCFAIAFTYRYVIETKGKSIDEIQQDLRNKMVKNYRSP